MEPQLGWVWLSQQERRAAEQALDNLGPDGTRDELGFGVIHFAYADRFFPGTSVQHTALRYVWFVCWSYLELQQRYSGGAFPRNELARIEDRTGHKLIKYYGPVDGQGIIGGRVLRVGRSPVTKPSAVYWNAMRSWGLVAPINNATDPPGRSEIHWRWGELTSRSPRPEVDPDSARPIFVEPPPQPDRWRVEDRPLSFALDNKYDEAGRIRRAWARQRDALGRPTLLSRLAERRTAAPTSMTNQEVLNLCLPDEKVSLRRARQAGALAAIARALHTAMVQRMKDASESAMADVRRWLENAVRDYGADAAKLDLVGLRFDVPEVDKLVKLIEATQAWLAEGAGDFTRLEPIYREREMLQKPGRALLARTAGDRRALWRPHDIGPLTYRWDRVAGFLNQLAGK
ncbi:hypothetical protein EN814_24040 [Mesorhizobium sp. M2D.F.Ca.ET.171.01.1.1]|uniref:DUF6361 family protein n=1 Tax=unclassified Mesorhizobium TaxID=325217 RepID=UPI001092ECF8|nr:MULTISPECIES: DUF6361 family protein [unclassified Mesorhizobium]TGS92714.1 hypothetical protein EN821_24055 [Mesorhizobium sp. M2D.F.Ca.ET.178.01.1.1]TGT08519.1 hypothetical protein EN814_24040 [Mesorhizobium sp. M2D.F.Ca.ET.171.01.1.1]